MNALTGLARSQGADPSQPLLPGYGSTCHKHRKHRYFSVAAQAQNPRSRPIIKRKELQKTAKLEYLKTFYEVREQHASR